VRPRVVVLVVLAAVVVYFGLYTWNAKTGYVDRFVAVVGLDGAGSIFRPGRALERGLREAWERYIYLVGVRQENENLRAQVAELTEEVARLREAAAEARRLRGLLAMPDVAGWQRQGARVVAHRPSPGAVLESLIVDVGRAQGVAEDMPVQTPGGLLGRIWRAGRAFSQVLLVADPLSRVPVVSQERRVPGVVCGQGSGVALEVRYVAVGQPVAVGEILVTSGLDGAFPRGIPVARITAVRSEDGALFQRVEAQPLVDAEVVEEVVVLRPESRVERP
jgi:rod shape-determining protein MreC